MRRIPLLSKSDKQKIGRYQKEMSWRENLNLLTLYISVLFIFMFNYKYVT